MKPADTRARDAARKVLDAIDPTLASLMPPLEVASTTLRRVAIRTNFTCNKFFLIDRVCHHRQRICSIDMPQFGLNASKTQMRQLTATYGKRKLP